MLLTLISYSESCILGICHTCKLNPTHADLIEVMDPECNALIKEVPIRCQKNATFVVNTAALQNPDDILADDNGVYKNNGTSYNLVTTFDEEIHSTSLKPRKLERDRKLLPGQYLLSKTSIEINHVMNL